MHFPADRTAHTIAFDGPVVDRCLECLWTAVELWKIAQTANASTMQGRSAMQEDPNLYIRVLYRLSLLECHLREHKTYQCQSNTSATIIDSPQCADLLLTLCSTLSQLLLPDIGTCRFPSVIALLGRTTTTTTIGRSGRIGKTRASSTRYQEFGSRSNQITDL